MKKTIIAIILATAVIAGLSGIARADITLWYLDGTTLRPVDPTWTIGVSGFAPSSATYITQTASGDLSAEQALSGLSSGIMRVATTTGVITSLTDSNGILSNISDEVGTGFLVFNDSPSFADDITIQAAGVKLTGDGDGALTFLGLGNGFDEDLTFNFDDVENTIGITTSTGVTSLNFGSLNMSAGTITASLTGNASTATALAADPADCGANNFATTIAASGALTCAAIADADVPNTITIDLATAATSTAITDDTTTNATMYPTWVTANTGNLAQKVTSTKLTFNPSTGMLSSTGFTGALTGNASTATALAGDPADCAANNFANAINASGTLSCAQVGVGGLSSTDFGTFTCNGSACTADNDSIALTTQTSGNYVTSVATTAVTSGLTGGAAASEGATLSLGLDYSATLAGNPALGANQCVFASTGIICEGATADTVETLLAFTDPLTTDKTVTFPNYTGTVALAGTLTNTKWCTTDGNVVNCTSNEPILVQEGDVADAGYLRLQNAAIIGWEAAPAGVDVTLTVDASEIMQASGTFNAATLTEGAVGVPNVNDNLSVFAATTSLQLLGVISNETGSGALVFGTAPAFTTSITTPAVLTGNVALTIGDATTDSITFASDGTGNAEFVFPADVIGDADIDWGTGAGQVSAVDITMTDAGAITSSGTITSSGVFDATGAVGITLGSIDITSITFTSDGTGNAEFTFPADVIGDADIDWGAGAGQVGYADLGSIVVADTSITAGRSLTWSTNDMVADAELYTDTKCLWIENPVATDDLKSIWYSKLANTITSIWCESDQTVTAMLQVDDGTPADVDSVDLTCDATPPEDTALDGDATLAAGDRLDLDVASVASTPTWVSICWTFTKDD